MPKTPTATLRERLTLADWIQIQEAMLRADEGMMSFRAVFDDGCPLFIWMGVGDAATCLQDLLTSIEEHGVKPPPGEE